MTKHEDASAIHAKAMARSSLRSQESTEVAWAHEKAEKAHYDRLAAEDERKAAEARAKTKHLLRRARA